MHFAFFVWAEVACSDFDWWLRPMVPLSLSVCLDVIKGDGRPLGQTCCLSAGARPANNVVDYLLVGIGTFQLALRRSRTHSEGCIRA